MINGHDFQLFTTYTLESFNVWTLTDIFGGPQMPVQPVTAAGPDHTKSLEKPELYPSLFQAPDQTKVLPSTPAPSTQIYSPANNFTTGRSNDVYRCVYMYTRSLT